MNKKSKMIAAVMLLAVSAAGLVLINYYNPWQEQQQEPGEFETPPETHGMQAAESCENFTGIEKAKCYLDEGDLNKSLDVCGNLSVKEGDTCYQGTALDITNKNISKLNKSIEICNRVTGGRFYCYTNLASIVVKSDLDAAIYVCDLTYPPYICYSTLGRVIAYSEVNETIALCRKINDSTCYTSAAEVIVNNDSKSALFLCRDCANTTRTSCQGCYFDAAKEIAQNDPKKAIDICNEGARIAAEYSYPFSYMCQINAADAVKEDNEIAAFEICTNLTGVNKARCYFKIINFSNNPGHVAEMCRIMTETWEGEPNVMRYCKDS